MDFFIFLVVILSAITFCFLGDGKIHKIYFGIAIGFLLFLVFNTQIQLLETLHSKDFNPFQIFLLENKELVLSASIFGIPILGILFLVNTTISINVKNNILFSILFGAMLPFFLLLLLSYVGKNSYVEFGFLTDILKLFSESSIFDLFNNNPSWAIFGLLFLLFYRACFLLLWAFLVWAYTVLRNEFFGEPKTEEEEGE